MASTSAGGQPRRRKRLRQVTDEPIHPFLDKVNKLLMRIQLDADKMIRLSDNDLILCNRKSGANNYDPNLTLARRLEIVSKKVD